jgi:hypothetical protein
VRARPRGRVVCGGGHVPGRALAWSFEFSVKHQWGACASARLKTSVCIPNSARRLLNATFGNIVELILSIAALERGLFTVRVRGVCALGVVQWRCRHRLRPVLWGRGDGGAIAHPTQTPTASCACIPAREVSPPVQQAIVARHTAPPTRRAACPPQVVATSLVGSILSNVLLVLGGSSGRNSLGRSGIWPSWDVLGAGWVVAARRHGAHR